MKAQSIVWWALFFLLFSTVFWGCGGDEVAGDQASDDAFSVGGMVSGLEAEGMVLQNNGGDDLTVDEDGEFSFSTPLERGEEYEVTILEAPSDHQCLTSNASGTIARSNITDIRVVCDVGEEPGEPAFFAVAIDESASELEVDEEDSVVVVAQVENIGEAEGERGISLVIDDQYRDSIESIELAGGESTTVTLEWETTAGDHGTYSAGVSSGDETDTATVVVHEPEVEIEEPDEPAYFAVDIDESESLLQVDAGGIIAIEAQVENTGDETGTQDVVLEIDGDVVDTVEELELEGGEDETVLLQWQTSVDDGFDYIATVKTDDDEDSIAVDVDELAPAFFEVTIDEEESGLSGPYGSDLIFLVVDVENTGELGGMREVTLEIGGDVADTVDELELEPGEESTLTLEWEPEEADIGEHTATVSSGDDQDSVDVEVVGVPHFEVTINEQDSTLQVFTGDTVEVEAMVENTGTWSGDSDVRLEIDGDVVHSEPFSLDAGEQEVFSLEWAPGVDDVGEHTAEVIAVDASDSVTVTVDISSWFDISIDPDESELQVEHGQPVVVEVEVDNIGVESATQDITLEINGVVEDLATDIELDGGEFTVLTLEWETEEGEAGTYTAEVIGDDDSDSASVTVIDPDADTIISGTVSDSDDQVDMEGVEVLVFEAGTDTIEASTIAGSDGDYEVEVSPGDYEMGLQAPGLEPNHDIEEAGADSNRVSIVAAGDITQHFNVAWIKETDLMIDGGLFDFQYDDPDGILAVGLPGCEQQPDGSWQKVGGDVDDDNIEVTYDPPETCFQINDISIDLLTGVFDVGADDVLFPKIEIYIDDQDDEFDENIEGFAVDFKWLIDHVEGHVDFTDGSLALDIDLRILVGGTAETELADVDFGSRANEDDCQLTGGWGGDIDDPTEDADDEQEGDYLHDPIELRLTTGESGPSGIEGEPYDAQQGLFVTVDNTMEVDRLSEGPLAGDDDGGASCGDLDLGFFGIEEDFAAILNDLLDLPAGQGSVLGEFDFLVPQP